MSGSVPSQPLEIQRELLLTLPEAVIAVAPEAPHAVVLYNAGAAALWGWSAEEAVRRPAEVLLGKGVDLDPGPSGRRSVRLHAKHKDGHGLFLRVGMSDALLAESPGGGEPVAVRRLTAEDVQQEDADYAQLRAIVDRATLPVVACRPCGSIVRFNRAAAAAFGLAQDEAIGADVRRLLEPPGDDAEWSVPEALLGGEPTPCGGAFMVERMGRRADGSRFPLRISLSEVDARDGHLHTLFMEDVTAEHAAGAALAAEQRRTAAIINSAFNAIVATDAAGTVELANRQACELFQLSQEEFIGRSLCSLVRLQCCSSGAGEAGAIASFLADASGTVRELTCVRADGGTFPARASISHATTEGAHLYTAILQDVTQEEQDQSRLAAANNVIKLERSKLRALLDSTVEGFIAVTSEGIIESFNKSATQIFGYEADEIIGQNVSTLIPWKIARRHDKFLKRYMAGGQRSNIVGRTRELRAQRKNGQEFEILLSVSEAVVGEEHYFTATVRDLSNELLLMNMLPKSIAARLQAKENPINDGHENVSILFADICGFTALSSQLTPFEVVTFLNDIFRDFDDLADTYKLEKIKTIGDCYMVVAGLPDPSPLHALKLACFAMEMRAALVRYNKRTGTKHPLNMRIGMHSGPVIAGVVGKRKFLYDIWGDAVNVASRMESTGVPGEIQVSSDFKDQLEDMFVMEDRGLINVKGKGEMRTWLLKAIRPEGEESVIDLLRDSLTEVETDALTNVSSRSFCVGMPPLGPILEAVAERLFPEAFASRPILSKLNSLVDVSVSDISEGFPSDTGVRSPESTVGHPVKHSRSLKKNHSLVSLPELLSGDPSAQSSRSPESELHTEGGGELGKAHSMVAPEEVRRPPPPATVDCDKCGSRACCIM